MIVSQAIGMLREAIKAYSDDSYEDDYLYDLFKSYRALFLKRTSEVVNAFTYWQTICMPLIRDTYHDCDCIDAGCLVLKSQYKIPRVINKRKDLLEIRTLDGILVPMFTPDEMRTTVRYSPVLKGRLGYYIENSKLIVWNSSTLEVILVKGVFEDPVSLRDIPKCDNNGNVIGECAYDPLVDELPVEDAMVPVIIEACLESLFKTLQVPEDRRNDGVSDIKNNIPQVPQQKGN